MARNLGVSIPKGSGDPVEILQKLVQFDTTNPPGNEKACIEYIQGVLKNAGIESKVLHAEGQSERLNLVARIRGRDPGKKALLLYGHVDVVPTENQVWKYPPFSGALAEDFVWGRGTLDMKGGVAMMLAAFIRAKRDKTPPQGDVLFCAVSDEEEGGRWGAKFLTEKHPELFKNVRYAIGEFGGFSLENSGKKFYPIQVIEKQCCRILATVEGEPGHGSVPVRGQAMAKMGRLLTELDKVSLPVHVTPVARAMILEMGRNIGGYKGFGMRLLTKPMFTDLLLFLFKKDLGFFYPMLHNTINPTILNGNIEFKYKGLNHDAVPKKNKKASSKFNVIPKEVWVELDGRVLPGLTGEDLLHELEALQLKGVKFEILEFSSGPSEPDKIYYEALAGVIREADPKGIPVPLLQFGATDAKHFSTLGIQSYGFLPMQLPPEMNFIKLIHGENERIPIKTLEFGTQAILRVIQAGS